MSYTLNETNETEIPSLILYFVDVKLPVEIKIALRAKSFECKYYFYRIIILRQKILTIFNANR